MGHDEVVDAAVIGIPDELAGELPFAFIVLKPQIASQVESDARARKDVQESIFKVIRARQAFNSNFLRADDLACFGGQIVLQMAHGRNRICGRHSEK